MDTNTNQKTQPDTARKRLKSLRYQAVTDQIRRQLSDGHLPAGIKLPALRDLAEKFKVSTYTVRSAINVLEREGCLYHVPSVGSFVSPNYPNRNRVVSKQTTVALVTIDIGGAFELEIARGIEQACHDRCWSLQIYDSMSSVQREARNLSRLVEFGTHGAIITPTGDHDTIETLFKLKLADYPFVLIDRSVSGLKVDIVESNHEKAAYLATQHILQEGHSHVLMVTEPPGVSSIDSRIRGYERALIDHGQEPRHQWKIWVDREVSIRGFRQGKRWLSGYEAVLPVLKNRSGPLAFFALDNYIAWGICEACRELGLRIPEDVSIVSIDDSDIALAMTPPMTVVAQRPTEIGGKAVELLERRILPGNDALQPQHIIVDVDLIRRQSVCSLIKQPVTTK